MGGLVGARPPPKTRTPRRIAGAQLSTATSLPPLKILSSGIRMFPKNFFRHSLIFHVLKPRLGSYLPQPKRLTALRRLLHFARRDSSSAHSFAQPLSPSARRPPRRFFGKFLQNPLHPLCSQQLSPRKKYFRQPPGTPAPQASRLRLSSRTFHFLCDCQNLGDDTIHVRIRSAMVD